MPGQGSEKPGKKGGELKTVSHPPTCCWHLRCFWVCLLVEASEIETEVVDVPSYCHMKFAPMDESTLAEKSIDLYCPCDYDSTGAAEVGAQRRMLSSSLHGDGSND
jgi:hypothetical protein